MRARSKVVKSTETENTTFVVCRAWKEGGLGSCLMDVELQVCEMQRSGGWLSTT